MARRGEHVITESGEPEAWRPAQLQRGYRKVLDRAKDRRQMILDTDGSMLVIEPKTSSDFAHELVQRLAEVAQFRTAFSAHAGVPASRWAGETPYPWLAAFDAEEVAEFARELVGFALDAAQRGSLEFFEGNLAAWRSTAEVYESPEQLEALLRVVDEGEIVELFPPSEEQARGARLTPHELDPPKGRYKGAHRVLANVKSRRGWNSLCQSRPGPMRTCYIELADRPFPAFPRPRHHALKGKLKQFWEYGVGGGERVRYKRHADNDPLVVYAGPAPADTH